jgi:hypothetical protein
MTFPSQRNEKHLFGVRSSGPLKISHVRDAEIYIFKSLKMKRVIYWRLLVGALAFNLISTGCDKGDLIDSADLENTTWKLTKEIWTFPSGNTQTFIKGDLDGIFSWDFINDKDVKISYSPYYVQENGTWTKANNRITITVLHGADSFVRNYKIVVLKGSFMKVDVEEQRAETSEGRASKVYYELRKQ